MPSKLCPHGHAATRVIVLGVLLTLACVTAGRAADELVGRANFDRRRSTVDEILTYTITVTGSSVSRSRVEAAPDFAAFDVLGGPSVGHSTQVQFVSGSMTRNEMVTLSWQLVARKDGNLSVAGHVVSLGGTRVSVPEASVSVAAPAPAAGGAPGAPPPGRQADPRARAGERRPWDPFARSAPRALRDDDLSVRTELLDDSPFVGQEIVLRHLIEFDVDVRSYGLVNPPEFPGFTREPREVKTTPVPHVDAATGRTLRRAPIAAWALVPLSAGDVELPSAGYEFDVVVPTMDFFGMGRSERVLRRTKPLRVKVRQLPEGAPPSFLGAVGSFRLQAEVTPAMLAEGDSASLVVTISGTGSFQGVSAPRIDVPPGLKLFPAEVNTEVQSDAAGHSAGRKTFTFPILAMEEGRHVLPGLEWTVFDPAARRYVTRTTQPLAIEVAAGTPPLPAARGTTATQTIADVTVTDADILHVRTALSPTWRRADQQSSLRTTAWLAFAAGPFGLAVLLVGRRFARWRRSDPAARRAAAARGLARRRLREGVRCVRAGRTLEGVEQAARAVSGFIADRLGLAESAPGAREAVDAVALAAGPELAASVKGFLDDCDFTRFAGGKSATGAPHLIERAESLLLLLSRLERGKA